MQDLTFKPSRQGDLDNLCGPYSIVNAIAYLYQDEKRFRRKSLKMALLRSYSELTLLDDLIHCGLSTSEMELLWERVILSGYYHKRFPVIIEKPFESQLKANISQVLNTIADFLSAATESARRIALVGTPEHWTLIHAIDHEFVYLLDSGGKKQIKRKSFGIRAGRATHIISKDSVYFIRRTKEVL